MRIIYSENIALAIVHKKEEWKEELDFLTDNESFIQVGTWNYNKGKNLALHSHKVYKREAFLTQEMVFVVSGSMYANIYTNDLKLVEKILMREGDLAIMLEGAHGYEILEDDTKIIEAKNGPFVSVELDKVKYQ